MQAQALTAALLCLSAHAAAAATEASAAKAQAHDEAKLLREKLPADVSDEKILDLTTQLLTKGVPTEVLTWYLNNELANSKGGDALVADVEALATTMGGGKRMSGSSQSLIEMIKTEEAIPDASLDAPFMWPEAEYAEDRKLELLQLQEKKLAKAEPEAEAKTESATATAVVEPAKVEATPKTEAKAETQAEASTGVWDVVFFVLLAAVVVVGGWWAYKMRLHDRFLAGVADLVFRAKKWVSGTLKGHDYQAQGDDNSSVSDTSLQTGSAATGTSASSAADGLNGHLQGVIDRVRTNFQQKETPDVEQGEQPKKGYTRRS